MKKARTYLRYAFSPDTVARAFGVALVITPVLTILNHYDAVVAMQISRELLVKVLLTFLVPYSVSTYSSVAAAQQRDAQNALLVSKAGEPWGGRAA